MAETKKYSLAQFIFNGTKITNNGFKTTRKQTVETRESTDDFEPYDYDITKEEHSWECSDIDPVNRKFFADIMDNQKSNTYEPPMVATYDYDKDSGDLVEDDVYYNVLIEEMSKENANEPFSVKGIALNRKSSV